MSAGVVCVAALAFPGMRRGPDLQRRRELVKGYYQFAAEPPSNSSGGSLFNQAKVSVPKPWGYEIIGRRRFVCKDLHLNPAIPQPSAMREEETLYLCVANRLTLQQDPTTRNRRGRRVSLSSPRLIIGSRAEGIGHRRGLDHSARRRGPARRPIRARRDQRPLGSVCSPRFSPLSHFLRLSTPSCGCGSMPRHDTQAPPCRQGSREHGWF